MGPYNKLILLYMYITALLVLTEKQDVGGAMYDKLDERFSHQIPDDGLGSENIQYGPDRSQQANEADLNDPGTYMLPTESRQPVVPERGQQLLTVRMSHKLNGERHDI